MLLGCITLPVRYWAPEQTFGHGGRAHGVQFGYFPNGPHGSGGVGLTARSVRWITTPLIRARWVFLGIVT